MQSSEAHRSSGIGGLHFPITQVSLVVDDLDVLLERYHRLFGWAPWQDFDHVAPVHHDEMYRGARVSYGLRGAEVYVGSLNFELLKPLEGGTSLFHDHLRTRGEGICSIASMFHERADGELVKVGFRDLFAAEVINSAEIGDHIEYFYVDTQAAFGCPIESGSGHAIDFVHPARIYPPPGSSVSSEDVGPEAVRIARVTLVVSDATTTVPNYERAFGWGPWRWIDGSDAGMAAGVRLAHAAVDDVVFEVVEPGDADTPWRSFLDRNGPGLMGVTVEAVAPLPGGRTLAQRLAAVGAETVAAGTLDGGTWQMFDARDHLKTMVTCVARA